MTRHEQALTSTPMRIAIIHENWGAGAARCAKDLYRELSRRHEVAYFPRFSDETPDQIDAALASFRPDVVHCHSFYGNLPYDFLEAVADRYPTCFTVHDPRPIGTIDVACWNCERNGTCRRCPLLGSTWRQFLRNPYYRQRRMKRVVHSRCRETLTLVAPSKWMAERLKASELYRFPLRHIPYGIDLKHFKPRAAARAAFGLPDDRPVILFSAWYESTRQVGLRKGMADLAEAFLKYVTQKMPEALLAVAGESFIPNHPNVRPLGLVSLDRLPELLSAADVYVLPTLADNLPYTILEAMGCGIPVVATKVGGIPEQIVDGETGYLIDPARPEELAAAILKILGDPQRAKVMGMNGRARAEAAFSMDRFVAAYESLFREMTALASEDSNSLKFA